MSEIWDGDIEAEDDVHTEEDQLSVDDGDNESVSPHDDFYDGGNMEALGQLAVN